MDCQRSMFCALTCCIPSSCCHPKCDAESVVVDDSNTCLTDCHRYSIKVTVSEAERSKCIQDKTALLHVSSKAMNARPKVTTSTEEDQDGGLPQEDEIEVGEPLEKVVLLFAAEREGKRWMDLLSGVSASLLCPARTVLMCARL